MTEHIKLDLSSLEIIKVTANQFEIKEWNLKIESLHPETTVEMARDFLAERILGFCQPAIKREFVDKSIVIH